MSILPTITLATAGILGFLTMALALRVVLLRRRYGIGLGAEGAPDLERAIRVHGNAVENVPLALMLLLLAELAMPTQGVVLAVIAAVLVIARFLHALGLSSSPGVSFGRFFGTLLTWLCILLLAGIALGLASSQLLAG